MRHLSKAAQAGISLVEIMLALALSSVLTVALYRIVLGNQQSVNLAVSFADVLEAAQTSFSMMSFDLRMAGYRGCVNNAVNITSMLDSASADYDIFAHDFDEPMAAIDGYNPATGFTFGGIQPIPGSDVFISRAAVTTDLYVGVEPLPAASQLIVAGPSAQVDKLIAGRILMVSDCQQGHIFAVSDRAGNTVAHDKSTATGPDNTDFSFNYAYVHGSQLLLMNTTVYFVAPSTLMPGVNALYRYSLLDDANQALELVPYVNDMQLTYGVDTDTDNTPDAYMTADQITAAGLDMFASVHSINVDLTLLTGNSNLNSRSYSFTVYVRNAGDGS